MTNVTIHEVVRQRYAAVATPQETSSCGDTAASGCGTGNDPQMLEGLPLDVTGLSLGSEGTQFTRANPACRVKQSDLRLLHN